MSENQTNDTIRDYLYTHGPARVDQVATACNLSVSEVLRHQQRGATPTWAPTPAAGLCTLCGGRARVNDLCDGCRHELIAGAEARL